MNDDSIFYEYINEEDDKISNLSLRAGGGNLVQREFFALYNIIPNN
jgi:hypothetical protein